MAPFLTFLSGLAGIVFLSALYQATLGIRGRKKESLALGLNSFALVLYIVCNILLYQVTTVSAYFAVERVQMFGSIAFALSLLWFVALLTRTHAGPIILPFAVIAALFIVARSVCPQILYRHVQGVAHVVTPWREQLSVLDGSLGYLGYGYLILYLTSFVTGLILVLRGLLRTRGKNLRNEQRILRLAVIASGVFLAAMLNDIVVLAINAKWIFLGETGYAAFVVLVGVRLAEEATAVSRLANQLAESEARYREIFENTSDSVFVVEVTPDRRYKLVAYNPAQERTLGILAADALGRFNDEYLPRNVLDVANEDNRRCIESGRPMTFEGALDLSAGRYSYHTTLVPIRDDTGRIARLIGVTRDLTELETTKAALETSQRELSSILSRTPEIIYKLDPEGRITFVNEAVRRHGYDPAAMIGTSIMDYVHPEDRNLAEHRLNERRTGARSTRDLELRMFTKKGAERIVEYSSVSLFDEPVFVVQAEGLYTEDPAHTGRFLGTQGVAHDITERKKAEKALRQSEQKFAQTFHSSFAALAISALEEGRYVDVNERFLETTGYSREEVIGRTGPDLNIWANPDQIRQLRDLLKRGGRVHGTEIQYRRKTGELGYGLVSAVSIDINGIPCLFTETVDITERKLAERTLELLKVSIDQSPDSSYWCDPEGRFLYVNDAGCRALGYSREELLRMSASDITPLATPERWSEVWRTVKSRGSLKMQSTHRRKDGTTFPVDLTSAYIRLGDNEYLNGFAMDLTERFKADKEKETLQTQLLQAQKMESIGRLAGGVAHDFNNMLSVILGNAEMALLTLATDVPARVELQAIQDAAERSANLTRQLLAFARKQNTSPRILDLNEVVAGMLKILQRLIGEGIELVWKPRLDLWRVKMDPSQIDQIMANLCVNARDAIESVGTLTIATGNAAVDDIWCTSHPGCVPGEYAQMIVSDNGAGMSSETLEHIFEPFFTTKGVGKGTGLGLATVYGIVKQNNGFIAVDSVQSKGTTFTIYLPRAQNVMEAKSETIEKGLTGGNETVLVIEDEESVLKLVTSVLERLGYKILVAQSPESALALVAHYRGPLHLMLSDIVMPGMNGRELYERIAAIRPEIKTLFISGYPADNISSRGAPEKEVQFLQKPFTMKALSAKMREVLDQD